MDQFNTREEWDKWFKSLPPADQQKLANQLKDAPRVGPSPGPQTAAFNSRADIIGYGGAAGGGKSALIALRAILKHQRTLILRYDANQMSGLIDDLVEFYGTDTGLNRQSKVFRLADRPGHIIEWGGLGKPRSQMVYRGIPHDCLAFDEATELDPNKVRFLFTWARTVMKGQQVSIILTFNPPDDSNGRWVIGFFAPWLDERHPNPAEPGELRYFATDEETGVDIEVDSPRPFKMTLGDRTFTVKPRSRTFFPATVQDNPYLTGTEYEQQLLGLPEPYRSQMLLGDFRRGIKDNPYQILPTAWVDEGDGYGGLRRVAGNPCRPWGLTLPGAARTSLCWGAGITCGGMSRTAPPARIPRTDLRRQGWH